MALQIRYETDVDSFRSRVTPFLSEKEAENNLPLGIIAGIVNGVQQFSDESPLLLSVEDKNRVQLVAIRTPPRRLILSTSASASAVSFLARELHSARYIVPGVTAPSYEAEMFGRAWTGLSRARMRRVQSQRIYRLDGVIPQRPVAGSLHLCDARNAEDVAFAGDWMVAFNRDVGEDQAPPDPMRFMGQRDEGLFFWKLERPVSMVAFSGPTPNGIRIGWVYTPPELRGRGYASAGVAAVSQLMLDRGRKFCFLYTDLANPTSNHIYQEIGYRPVCDATVWDFESE